MNWRQFERPQCRARTFRPPEFYDKEIAGPSGRRLAHRLVAAWRQFLSRLENRQLVDTDRTRTNREYLAQLRGNPVTRLSALSADGIVDAYDRYIYGHTSIGESDWNLLLSAGAGSRPLAPFG